MTTLQQSIIKMEPLSELQEYYNLTKKQIFDKMKQFALARMSLTLTFYEQISIQYDSVLAHISHLSKRMTNNKIFKDQLTAYINLFNQYASSLKQQCQYHKHSIQKIQTEVILKLEKSQLSFFEIQKRILKYGNQEMLKFDNKISNHQKRIDANKKEIQSYKLHCFVRMMEFAKQQSQSNINIKYNREEDENNRNKYGQMCSEMMDYFQEKIPHFQETIFSELQKIKKIQQQRGLTFDKINLVFFQAEQGKIEYVQQFAAFYNNHYKEQHKILQKYPYVVKTVTMPKRGTFSKLKYMKTAVDLTLHPHSHNEQIINHRQSLSSTFHQEKREINLQLDKQFKFQKPQSQIENIKNYDLLKIFFNCLHHTFSNSQNQSITQLVLKIEQALKYKTYRQFFVFFLYQQYKKTKNQSTLTDKQVQILKKIINVFLRKCHDQYDSPTAIKLILVILQIKTDQETQFYKTIDLFHLIKNFQFWQTTFIENIYQYCQMIVILYHQQLQSLLKQHSSEGSKPSFWNFLKPIQKIFKTNQHKVQHCRQPIKEIYHFIIKNVYTIFFSLMKLLHVPDDIVNKLKAYVVEAIEKQNFTEQIQTNLKESLQKLLKKEEVKFKQLLCNELVLQRTLSKLIGPETTSREQRQKESVSLSELINDWYKQ